MDGIVSLVPGFDQALDKSPATRAAWNALSSDAACLDPRERAVTAIVVAQDAGCEYARWVVQRLASRQGLNAEEILLATAGTGRDAHCAKLAREAASVLRGGHGGDAVKRGVALALLGCRILRMLAPASNATSAQRGA